MRMMDFSASSGLDQLKRTRSEEALCAAFSQSTPSALKVLLHERNLKEQEKAAYSCTSLHDIVSERLENRGGGGEKCAEVAKKATRLPTLGRSDMRALRALFSGFSRQFGQALEDKCLPSTVTLPLGILRSTPVVYCPTLASNSCDYLRLTFSSFSHQAGRCLIMFH